MITSTLLGVMGNRPDFHQFLICFLTFGASSSVQMLKSLMLPSSSRDGPDNEAKQDHQVAVLGIKASHPNVDAIATNQRFSAGSQDADVETTGSHHPDVVDDIVYLIRLTLENSKITMLFSIPEIPGICID